MTFSNFFLLSFRILFYTIIHLVITTSIFSECDVPLLDISENAEISFLTEKPETFHGNEPTLCSSTSQSQTASTSHRKSKLLSKSKNLLWKNKNINVPNNLIEFSGNTNLSSEIKNLDTPYNFFKLFFTDDILEHIRVETIRYSVQQTPNKPLTLTSGELRKYIGICCIMSFVNQANLREYWKPLYGCQLIQDTMLLSTFEKIKTSLHFNDNTKNKSKNDPNYDRLYKIRPIITKLQENLKKIPYEEHLSVDEQMCATKSRNYLKQYLPNKPHKWGFKLFVLCDTSGFSYNFEVYTGKENNPDQRFQNEPDLGASANVVVRLCRNVPKHQNYKIFFDNYYTSIDFLVHLAKQGIHALGTVRPNRVPNKKIRSDKEMKKKDRGTSIEMLTTVERIDISFIIWKDTKCVYLLSNYAGEQPLT